MSAHSPGPWVVRMLSWCDVVEGIYDAGGEAVAETRDDGGYISKDDAPLIAAAPDLLAALKLIVEADGEKSLAQIVAAMPDARAAIAKAEGR
jgi:hypothetical protein